jgi:hypothetical protein
MTAESHVAPCYEWVADPHSDVVSAVTALGFISALSTIMRQPNPSVMPDQDKFTLSGDYENRVLEALKVAQHQVRLAQPEAAARMQAALTGLDDALSDQIAWLENAAEDDKADAEESGEAERERQAWRPLRAA